MLESLNCGNYIVGTEIIPGQCKVTVFNQMTSRKGSIVTNNALLMNILNCRNNHFAMLHFMAWLTENLPEDVAVAMGLDNRMEPIRKQLIKQFSSRGVSKKALAEIGEYLLYA